MLRALQRYIFIRRHFLNFDTNDNKYETQTKICQKEGLEDTKEQNYDKNNGILHEKI